MLDISHCLRCIECTRHFLNWSALLFKWWQSINQSINLSPRSRDLQKLTVTQLVKKFPSFYETRNFITVFTRAATDPRPEPDACLLSVAYVVPKNQPKSEALCQISLWAWFLRYLLAPSPTPLLEGRPLLAVRNCLQYICSYSSNLKMSPLSAIWDRVMPW
jgi:hypothetical protein